VRLLTQEPALTFGDIADNTLLTERFTTCESGGVKGFYGGDKRNLCHPLEWWRKCEGTKHEDIGHRVGRVHRLGIGASPA
jgi:hypothetical protein